jgi:hypothetical protein
VTAIGAFSGALEDGTRRELVYGGDLLVFKKVPPMEEFCAFADALIREVFRTEDPVRARFELDRDECLYFGEALRRWFRNRGWTTACLYPPSRGEVVNGRHRHRVAGWERVRPRYAV